VVLCFWGETGEEEILEVSSSLREDPEFSSDYDSLVDTSNLRHSVSGEEVRDLAQPRIAMSANRRLAVVARMHQLLSESRNALRIEVFRDRISALAWLGKEGLGLDGICEELAAEHGEA